MELPIIKEILIIFALSIGVLLICHRLRLPPVVGFLVTGVLCGPHGLGLVKGIEDVQDLATIGIVLLLFTVGMEFSIKNIVRYKYYFFVGGALQVFVTVFATMAIAKWVIGRSYGESVFLGFLISLSSTAIVLRVLEEKGESESPHGRLTLGILIFQDIIAIPMMLLVPMLAGGGEKFEIEHLLQFVKGIAVLGAMGCLAYYGVPRLLYYVTRTRNRELFLLTVLTICFSVAWVTQSIGLSLSLGAFLAGLIVSESEYSDEAVGNILPFQEIFTSFFFVSMGMLLDVGFLVDQPFFIIGIAAAVIALKMFVAGGTGLALGMPLRSAVLAGVALAQVGEFSFVLAHSGIALGLSSGYHYQLFLAVSLLTMGLTPLMIFLSHQVARAVEQLPLPPRLKTGLHYATDEASHGPIHGHIIIAGFGVRGRHVARAAKESGIPYLILEMNPETVKTEKMKGEPIRYGDPSHPSVLLHAGIKRAKSMAVVINDPVAAKHIVRVAKALNPDVYVITRTRYFQEVPQLFSTGADDVIPDELGSSLEIVANVLRKSEVSPELMHRCISDLRREGYEALRLQNRDIANLSLLEIGAEEAKIEMLTIHEKSALVGRTVHESGLRKVHGLTVLFIKRSNRTITSIEADTLLHAKDTVVVIGTPQSVLKAKELFLAS